MGGVNWEKSSRGVIESATRRRGMTLLLSVALVGIYYKNKTKALLSLTVKKPNDPCFSLHVAFVPTLSNLPFDHTMLHLSGMAMKNQPSILRATKLQLANQLMS